MLGILCGTEDIPIMLQPNPISRGPREAGSEFSTSITVNFWGKGKIDHYRGSLLYGKSVKKVISFS